MLGIMEMGTTDINSTNRIQEMDERLSGIEDKIKEQIYQTQY